MADVIQLILDDHRRICALLDALPDLIRDRGAGAATGSPDGIWRQLRGLLDLHTEAEEEICFLDLFGPGPHAADQMQEAIADHDDIREAIREADLQPAGSAAWWRAVTAARRAAGRHIVREELQSLAAFARRAAPGRREELGRQWILFVEARVRDAPAHYGFTHAAQGQDWPG
jgi:hypothetical protein